jgi:hypothetical protein
LRVGFDGFGGRIWIMSEGVIVWLVPMHQGHPLPPEAGLRPLQVVVTGHRVEVEWTRSTFNETSPLVDAIGFAAVEDGPIERIESFPGPYKIEPGRSFAVNIPIDITTLNRIRLAQSSGA